MKKINEFNRYTAFTLIMIIVFSSIISKLYYLQIVKAKEYKEKASKRAITEIQDFAPRGRIYDKNNVLMADNKQSYMLTFTETDESELFFFKTMDQVFKILDKNKEIQDDDFELKVKPFSFQFEVSDDEAKKAKEIMFKKYRGFYDKIKHKLYSKKKERITKADEENIKNKMLGIKPKEVFDELVNQYKITPQDIFKSYVSAYKSTPEQSLDLITSQYKIKDSVENIKSMLEQYKKEKKAEKAKKILNNLMDKCSVNNAKFTVEQQRRYMIIKDALRMHNYSGYKPIVISSNIKKDTAIIFAQKLNELPGIDINIQPTRVYPYNELGASVIGYISRINSNIEKYEEKGYEINTDFAGVSGIEGAYEDILKGSKGGRIVKLNKQGRVCEELGKRESYPGQNIQLTIDSNVQYAAEIALDATMKQLQAMGKVKDVDTTNATRGAAVAIDVNTGAVLALASRPGFNPNDFVSANGLSTDLYKKYFCPDYVDYGKSRKMNDDMIKTLFPLNPKTNQREDKYDFVPKPLYNYATSSLTPPGSTFKPITAVAGLDKGVITQSTIVNDQGFFDDGQNFRKEFKADGRNGDVDLKKALAKSSNPYFMTVGKKLRESFGDESIAQYAWKFGLGVNSAANVKPATGIEIPELFGQVYYPAYASKINAQNYLNAIMDDLKNGKSNKGSTFTPIFLTYQDNDGDELRKIKGDIKNLILDSARTGKRAESTYRELINKLVVKDDIYKNKKISSSEISTIIHAIWSRVIDEGYYQLKGGYNMYNASIGQGFSNFTPLQLANFVATLVNGGTRYKVHIVNKILTADGKVVVENKPEIIERAGINKDILDTVKCGMHEVVTDGGTAEDTFSNFPIPSGGKTGSATYNENTQEQLGRTSYGVYVGFAPLNNPKIAVAVLILDGGHGGYVAPVAKAIYEAYFKKELDELGYIPQFDVKAKSIR